MTPSDRPTRLLAAVVVAARLVNWIAVAFFVIALIVILVRGDPLAARIAVKYGTRVDAWAAIRFMQALMVAGIGAGLVVERLLRALAGITASIGVGDPFHHANAKRLRIVGLMLLVLQLLDLALGAATLVAHRLGIDFIGWQPSFTGWIAVLVAFVLARVFRVGAAMRDDLDGTI